LNRWSPSDQYQKIAEANREFYSQTAQLYDQTETCVIDTNVQERLEKDLDRIISLTGKSNQAVHCLDACGGTGNVALKLLRRGVEVTISDISSAQLDIFRCKIEKEDLTAHIVECEIGELLTRGRNTYDLIVFSSALHHLENIENILLLAYDSLRSGGMLFTAFDPTLTRNQHLMTRIILRMDYLFFKVFSQTRDLPFAVIRNIRRKLGALSGQISRDKQTMEMGEATLGVLAEYHADEGIDDFALVKSLEDMGYELIWHIRASDARYRLARFLIEFLKDATQFKLLLRKTH
jgi:2-polyprenyl-3-methyl-5-hydroxy-6-metoxy-1,4-benzoquinol methylase